MNIGGYLETEREDEVESPRKDEREENDVKLG